MNNTIRICKEDNHLLIHLPYSPERVAKMRTLPHRQWDANRKVWIVAHVDATIKHLRTLFADDRVQISPSDPKPEPPDADSIVHAMENEMKLRHYSYRTRKTYRNQIKRFVSTFDKSISEITNTEIRDYLVHLVDDKAVSRNYLNQVISAIKFVFRQVLK